MRQAPRLALSRLFPVMVLPIVVIAVIVIVMVMVKVKEGKEI